MSLNPLLVNRPFRALKLFQNEKTTIVSDKFESFHFYLNISLHACNMTVLFELFEGPLFT